MMNMPPIVILMENRQRMTWRRARKWRYPLSQFLERDAEKCRRFSDDITLYFFDSRADLDF